MTQYSSLLRGLAAGSAFLFLFAPTAFAAEQTVEAPSVDARAWILMDYASGKVLAEGNADEKLDPASLTKIMTSYVVGQALKADKIKLTDMVTVGKDAWATGNPALRGSSVMFLKPGDQVSVADLNKGVIIQSGNDACIALADYVAGSQESFIGLMNGYAKKLGNNSFGGVDMVISGNVPQGAGLSSSASLEVAVGTVLQQLYHLPLDGAQIALNGQEAENQFVGCNCGIMDQLISALGKKDHALLIDCRSLGTKAVSMPKGVAVVIINSNFKRTLVGSEYNTRREQCETGARFFQQPALRDVTIEEFNAVAHELDPIVAKRVRHILTENARTVEAASALEQGDLKRMGELMAESHASMRDDFEITVPQIDTLVEIVKAVIGDKGGVRMTGGGFGGCIVALIPEELVPAVQQAVAEQYEAKTGIKETFYVCKPSQGAGQC